jgi:hypothetical protein
MPIEDVDYLKQNSIKQSFMFIVDSAERNHDVYSTPSQYTIDFTVPFLNVVGFQVIDANIPRTMYNVDIRNNSISFFIHTPDFNIKNIATSNYVGADGSRTVDIGDYTIQTLIIALNSRVNNDSTLPMLLQMRVNNVDDESQPLVPIIAEAASDPPEVKNLIRFRCAYPFIIDMKNSSISETLGFDLFTQPALESKKPILQQRYSDLLLDPTNRQLYHSVDLPANEALGGKVTIFEGPRDVIRISPINTYNYIAQSFEVEIPGFFTQLNAALYINPSNTNGNVSVNQKATWYLYNSSNNKPFNLITTNVISVSSIDGNYSDTNNNFQIFLNRGQYWIVMTSEYDAISLFYSDIPSDSSNNKLLYFNDTSDSINPIFSTFNWNSYDDTTNGVYYNASIEIIFQNSYHYLVAPGIYSLIGERVIVLRCPEIEEHSFRSLAFTKNCMGLAKFTLGNVGYGEHRMDFTSIPVREFHPIGKLGRLTVRFETLSGELYDFKGVNHTITFAVFYYEPKQQELFKNSILNPNYNANFLGYMNSLEAEEEDSDDHEEEYSKDQLENYRITENRHLPETIDRLDQEALYRYAYE